MSVLSPSNHHVLIQLQLKTLGNCWFYFCKLGFTSDTNYEIKRFLQFDYFVLCLLFLVLKMLLFNDDIFSLYMSSNMLPLSMQ